MKKKIAIAAVRLMVVAGIFGVVYNAKADCGPGMGNPCVPEEYNVCSWDVSGGFYMCFDMKNMKKAVPITPIVVL